MTSDAFSRTHAAESGGSRGRVEVSARQLERYVQDLKSVAESERQHAAELAASLQGSIEVMVEVLSLVNPVAFGCAIRVRCYVKQVVTHLELGHAWEYEAAALLSRVGFVTVPPAILLRDLGGGTLSPLERDIIGAAPSVARRLLARIPRFAAIAEVVGRLTEPLDAEVPTAGKGGGLDPVSAARIIFLATELDRLVSAGMEPRAAIEQLIVARLHEGDEALSEAFRRIRLPGKDVLIRTISVGNLAPGMVLDHDVLTRNGVLVAQRGSEVTVSMRERLNNFAALGQIEERCRVRTTQLEGIPSVEVPV